MLVELLQHQHELFLDAIRRLNWRQLGPLLTACKQIYEYIMTHTQYIHVRKMQCCFKQINSANSIMNEYVSLNERDGKFIIYSCWNLDRLTGYKFYPSCSVGVVRVYSCSNKKGYDIFADGRINVKYKSIFGYGCCIKGNIPEWLHKYTNKKYISIYKKQTDIGWIFEC